MKLGPISWWRVAVSVALLGGLGYWLDGRTILGRLAQLKLGWVAAAIVLSVFQVTLSAWRWRFTAARLGLVLPLRRAIREYYLGIFINQLLPGGVVGDVSRAWRHSKTDRMGPAIKGVILERASGQIVMTVVALCSCLALPDEVRRTLLSALGSVAALVVALAVAVVVFFQRIRPSRPVINAWFDDIASTLLLKKALVVQLSVSLLIVSSYLAVFVMAARGLGVITPATVLLPLIGPVLVTMLIPVTIAGWGVREGAAALLWAAGGLSAADGVAIAAAYGLIVLVSSLPGAVVLVSLLQSERRL